MADKNQLSLANGAPPQLFSANSLLQSDYILQGQAQTRHSAGMDLSMNSNQLQKPMTSIVNGQVSPNVETPNWPQNSVSLSYSQQSGAGDSLLHQQPVMTLAQQSSPFQMNKSNVTYSGVTNPKLSPNSNLSAGQQGSSVSMPKKLSSVTPTSMGQSPLNAPLIKQNLIRPSPVVGNRPKASSAGVVQPALSSDSDVQPLPQSFQHTIQSNPIPQYSGLSPANPPNMTPANSLFPSQIRNQLYGPPTSMTLPPKSSSFNKSPIPNPPYTTYMPSSTLQGTIPPTQLENPNQGSFSSKPPFSNVSQSFPQPNFQPQLTHHSLKGIPQGYQPLHSSTNQYSQKASTSNEPLSNEKQPRHGCAYSEHSTPIYQNQFVANRDLGHLASGMAPMPSSIQKQPNLLPLSDNIYGSTKPVGMNTMMKGMEKMSITQQGFNKLWGTETIDLLQCRNILPPQKVTPPPIRLLQEFMNNVNCSSEIFCCTLNKIPETNSLLQKSRLPLGILIHPFKDLSQLAVIQCSSIVRCRVCRTYINPFVYFVDNKRWKCNLCFRVNELPDEFQYDPVSKTYGDPSRRPEIRSSTIEFIAPSEYMLRPPQPAIYLFVLDVSRWGCDTGYLDTLCSVLLEELDNIPGDSRTQIGFILFDSTVHFFSIAESYNQAHEMIVTDIDEIFLPTPDSLLVNLNENRQLIKDLLQELPRKYAESFDTDSALGPALQAAYKLMSPTGGRITVFQSCLPNKGPGALGPREDPNQRSSRDVRHLGPQTDFYKRLSLDCSTQQISVDLFLVSSQYSDLATLSGVSQFSGGCIYHFPLFRRINPESNERLARALRRYLTRKIGFEAIMRVRCSRGLSIHTFHGNFFVRSTDLLSLPNVNPDAGFGMQIAIEDSLFELQSVCFQAAVLYTSAKGERRIRVHTLCLPVSSNLNDILTSADQQAIIGLLGKMAVDRSLKSTLSDAREAFINVAIDILSAYKLVETSGGQNSILAPVNLSLIPLYILALLKSTAFRTGQSTRLDDRVYAMSQMKTLPLRELIQLIHPDLYHVTHLDDDSGVEFEDKMVPQPARLSLSSEHLDSRGAFLLDTPEIIYILIGKNISADFLVNIFDVNDIRQINKDLIELPELENDESEKLRHFINFLQSDKPWPAVIQIATEPNVLAPFLINDKAENALSYYELLNHVKAQMK